MNSANIIAISVFLLIQLIAAKPQYGTYGSYGTYPYYGNTQPVIYNPVPSGQNQAPTFSNLSGTTANPLYTSLGYNTNTNYAASNGYYNNGYATNQANLASQASQANQVRIWPFVMGSTYSNYGYNTPNVYSNNYSYK